MATLTIRGVPDEVLRELKHEAVDTGGTLRDVVLRRLQGEGPAPSVKKSKPSRVEKVVAPIPESPIDPPAAKPTGYRNIKVTLFPGKKCRQHGVFECITGDCYKWVREE